MPSTSDHLLVEGLSKSFGPVKAVKSASFSVRRGELHCLLGENGAGKSTLSECLYGFYRPDEGQIFIDGEPVDFHSPKDAIRRGVGMVHQHFILVSCLSVLENIILGTHERGWNVCADQARRKLKTICDRYGIHVDLDAKIWQLSVGQQQWVEILKALYLGADFLIMDEPSAVLTPIEAERLYDIISKMTTENHSVLLISHKFVEVMKSDRVTVLRKGEVVGTVDTKATNENALVDMMIGRSLASRATRTRGVPGNEILKVSNLKVRSDRGTVAVDSISFSLRKGEILGIAGVAGNGQKELFEALVGARSNETGSIVLDSRDITRSSPKSRIKQGLGYIPDDRFRSALVEDFSVEENLCLGFEERSDFSSRKLLDFKQIRQFAEKAVADFSIRTPSAKAKAKTLSGGNSQKIVLAREIWACRNVMLASQPTRGLDVGVVEFIYSAFAKLRRDGKAILLASEELEDLLSLCDRIAVIFKGKFVGVYPTEELSIEKLGRLMTGMAQSETVLSPAE